MATKRLSLRNRVSVSAIDQTAHLDDLPKAQQVHALQSKPMTRSMSKKVEQFLLCFQTPSRTNQCDDRAFESPSTTGIQKVSEEICTRRLLRVTGTLKSATVSHQKEKALPSTTLSQEEENVNGRVTPSENDELPKLWLTESPGERLEKEVQKPGCRKSQRIASLLYPNPTGNIDSISLGGSGTKPEVGMSSHSKLIIPDQVAQTEMCNITGPGEELQAHAPETQERPLLQGTSPRNEKPLLKTWDLRSKNFKLVSGKQEEKAERMETECSGARLPAPISHEDRTDVEGSEYLGSECSETSDHFDKTSMNGEEPIVLSAVNNEGSSEVSEENQDGVGKSTQFAEESGTISTIMVPATEPDDSSPSASKGRLESVTPAKQVNMQVAKMNVPEPEAPKVEADGPSLSGAQVLLEVDMVQASMPESGASAPEPGGSLLPDVAPSEFKAGEPAFPGLAASELLAEGKFHPEPEVSMPGLVIFEAEGTGSNCEGLSISGPEAGRSNLSPFSTSENEPYLTLKPHHSQKQKLVNVNTSQQESQCQSAAASEVQCINEEEDSLCSSMDTCEFEKRGIGFKSMEGISNDVEMASALNSSEDSVALEPAESLQEEANISINCYDAVPAPEVISELPCEDPSSLAQTWADVSDVVTVRLELPLDPGSSAQLDSRDQNGAFTLQHSQKEETTSTGKGGGLPSPTRSENKGGPMDSVSQSKRRKRRRRRRRRKKSLSVWQTDRALEHVDSSADGGLQGGESTISMARDGAVIRSAGRGPDELRSKELRVGRRNILNSQINLQAAWNQTKRHTERDVPSNIKKEDGAEPLTTSLESLGEKGMRKLETKKAGEKEAGTVIKEAGDQATEFPVDWGWEAKEKGVGRFKWAGKSGRQLMVGNLDSSKTFGELQIALIRFFMEKEMPITSVEIRKSRKRGLITFLTRKDLIEALHASGEELLGRTLRLRRPKQNEMPMAILSGKKRKLVELDRDSVIPSPTKKRVHKLCVFMKESRKNQPKKKKMMPAVSNEEGEDESASLPKKKKRNHQEKVALSGKSEELKVHAEPLKRKKIRKTSWCLYLQKIEFRGKTSKMKGTIDNFLNESLIGYKKIILYPSSSPAATQKRGWRFRDRVRAATFSLIWTFHSAQTWAKGWCCALSFRCSACVELHCEEDLNELMKLDAWKILGPAVSLSKVEKLGALHSETDHKTLCIKHLPAEVSAIDLKKLLKDVAGVWIQENQKNKRFAIVAFKTTEAASDAQSKCRIECKGTLIQLKSVQKESEGVENIRVPEENGGQSQGVAYVHCKTAEQAKAALAQLKKKGVQGQAIEMNSPAEGQERSGKKRLQEEKKKMREKCGEARKKGSPEKRLDRGEKRRKRCVYLQNKTLSREGGRRRKGEHNQCSS
ncbi:uncharacterized protein [Narcine bancroftii]|uniref:uncharacterized protein isoform X2 n=1 Tax=Narcine bancroftii TaxID=1343680 RepID=UPI003831BE42